MQRSDDDLNARIDVRKLLPFEKLLSSCNILLQKEAFVKPFFEKKQKEHLMSTGSKCDELSEIPFV